MTIPICKKIGRPVGTIAQYRVIASLFLKKISSGIWKEGLVLPSYKTLAEDFRCGVKTIRLALQHLASEKKVFLNSKQHWVVNYRKGGLSCFSNCVVLISTDWTLMTQQPPLFRDIVRTLGKYKRQFHIIYRHHIIREMAKVMIPDIQELMPEGIILHGGFSQKCIKQYFNLGIPMVLADLPSNNQLIASVTVDNQTAAKDAVLRLAQLGHRRIAFCRRLLTSTAEVESDSLERQLGFLEGLKEIGVKNGNAAIYNFFFTETMNKSALHAILQARPRYTAVFVVDDLLAHNITQEAQSNGLAIPQDLSVVSFGAVDILSPYAGPRVDFGRIGYEAVELLESRMLKHIRIPTVWYEGTTFAAPNPNYL